jgi:hypothetical protein
MGATVAFVGRIIGGIAIMGACAAGMQVLSNTTKEVGRTVLSMITQLWRSYKNRAK